MHRESEAEDVDSSTNVSTPEAAIHVIESDRHDSLSEAPKEPQLGSLEIEYPEVVAKPTEDLEELAAMNAAEVPTGKESQSGEQEPAAVSTEIPVINPQNVGLKEMLQRLLPVEVRPKVENWSPAGLLIRFAFLIDIIILVAAFSWKCLCPTRESEEVVEVEEAQEMQPAHEEKLSDDRADSPTLTQLPTPARSEVLPVRSDLKPAVIPTPVDSTAAAAKELPQQAEEEEDLVVMFTPGELSIFAFWDTGIVEDVDEGSPAQLQGITKGMRFKTLDGQPYTEALLDQKIHGDDEFEVVFSQAES